MWADYFIRLLFIMACFMVELSSNAVAWWNMFLSTLKKFKTSHTAVIVNYFWAMDENLVMKI